MLVEAIRDAASAAVIDEAGLSPVVVPSLGVAGEQAARASKASPPQRRFMAAYLRKTIAVMVRLYAIIANRTMPVMWQRYKIAVRLPVYNTPYAVNPCLI
jgi:hypothetical protein